MGEQGKEWSKVRRKEVKKRERKKGGEEQEVRVYRA